MKNCFNIKKRYAFFLFNPQRIFGFSIVFLFLLIIFLLNFSSEGNCAQVTLVWDPNSETDLAGYKIYTGTQSRNYTNNVDVGNTTTYTMNNLSSGTTYYIAATAYNTQGLESGYSNEVIYTAPAASCTYTLSPTSATFASSGGTGSVNVTTQSGCNWSTSNSSSWITINSGTGTGSGAMSYSVLLNTGATRTANLTIAGNVFSITETGVAVGNQSPPLVTTGPATSVSSSSATLNGTVNPNGTSTTYLFQWGRTSSYGNATAVTSAGGGTGNVIVSADISGLRYNRTYHFRLVATNRAGTSYGVDQSFIANNNQNNTLTYTVTSSAGIGGSISPSGRISLQSGANQTFTITPNSGYIIGDVTVDGLSQGMIRFFTFSTVNANHTITASFAPISSTTNPSQIDFNSDGMADILWRNKQSGQIAIWYMNGITPAGSEVVANFPYLDWEIVGTGDFNRDGKPDLLWRNKQNGQIAVWYMNGITPAGSELVADYPYLDWKVVGTGDFNSDGKPDILWRNKVSGQIYVWYMNGVSPISSAWVSDFSDLNWKVVGTGDFNSDGKPDILWRNKVSGQIYVWYMNGVSPISPAGVSDSSDLNWEIVSR